MEEAFSFYGRYWRILLQKFQKARRLIFCQRTKQATIAHQCRLKPVIGIACEFGARRRAATATGATARPSTAQCSRRASRRIAKLARAAAEAADSAERQAAKGEEALGHRQRRGLILRDAAKRPLLRV
jgi:hypothetical protein